MEHTIEKKGRVLVGTVVSDKMRDTIVVAVERLVKHPKYRKYMRRTTRIKAHDAGNTRKVGERVQIRECRPLSRHKHFIVI
jgi:small subunit ribosomal protein S17